MIRSISNINCPVISGVIYPKTAYCICFWVVQSDNFISDKVFSARIWEFVGWEVEYREEVEREN